MDAPFIDDTIHKDRQIHEYNVHCRGDVNIAWYVVPGTSWSGTQQNRMDEAAAWYHKYCIRIDFQEVELDPDDTDEAEIADELSDLADQYVRAVRIIPEGAPPDEEDDLFTVQTIVDQIEAQIRRKIGRHRILVLFLDEWYIKTGVGTNPTHWREHRVSANAPDRLLVGIDRYDQESRHILTHELTHTLRKELEASGRDCIRKFQQDNGPLAPPARPWHDHYSGQNQDRAMSHTSRTGGFREFNNDDRDVLTVAEYLLMLNKGHLELTEGGCDEFGMKRPPQGKQGFPA